MRARYRTQVFPKHTHEFFTIGVVIDGEGTMWYRGRNHVTRCGDVVVIPPGEVHTGAPAPGAPVLSYLAAHVPGDVLAAVSAELQGLRRGEELELEAPVIRDAALAKELRRINAAYDAADEALLLALDLLIRRHAKSPQLRDAARRLIEPRLVRVTRDVIEDCYGDNSQTSLQALAQRVGVSPFYLVRVFTRTTGLSPHRYLVQTRVRHAAQFLAKGVEASFVAAMTGFADQSHLTMQFKRYVGITPSSYQRCIVAR